MTAFVQQDGQRTHCAVCGTPRHAHDYQSRACPEPYRLDDIERAQRDLANAEAADDQVGIFVARGEVQRLSGRAT